MARLTTSATAGCDAERLGVGVELEPLGPPRGDAVDPLEGGRSVRRMDRAQRKESPLAPASQGEDMVVEPSSTGKIAPGGR